MRYFLAILITFITFQTLADEIDDLILQLNSDDYQLREQAEHQLSKLGQAARPQLEAATQSENIEISLKAVKLVRNLKIDDLWKSTLINCDETNISTLDAIKLLNGLSGNTIVDPSEYNEKSINLKFTDTPYWKVLDTLCEQTGNQIRPTHDFRNPGVTFAHREYPTGPVVYHGPIRSRILSAKRVFLDEFNYEHNKSEITHTFQITLQLMWEDKFRIIAHRSHPNIVEAITNNGSKLSGTGLSDSWTMVQRGPYQATMSVNIQPPSIADTHFKSLKLKWGVLAVGDMEKFEIPIAVTDVPHYDGDLDIIIEEINQRLPEREEIVIKLNRDLILPHPSESVFYENTFKFLDANGSPISIVSQSNHLGDDGVRLKFVLQNSGAEKLQLEYPRIRSRKDVEIEFTDVPLPISVP